jgi:hypothetical protein
MIKPEFRNRNYEISNRHKAGEARKLLAVEYKLTVSRIDQILAQVEREQKAAKLRLSPLGQIDEHG